jgi:outer membrane immunogenic protein
VKRLKPILSGTVFSALAATPALAQAPIFNWTGFYAGANLGGAWARQSIAEAPGGIGWFTTSSSNDSSGVIGGVQAGQNWQVNNVVYGVEADIDFSSASDRTVISAANAVTHDSKLTALATLRGRVGIAADRTLFFVTAGGAYGRLKGEIVDPPNGFVANRDSSAWGWVAGGGIEHAFANNWTARVEFLHARLGSDTVPVPNYVFRFKDSVSVARAAINYRY